MALLVILALVLAIGTFGLGLLVGRRPDRKAQKELDYVQQFVAELALDAAEHAALGDAFAVITLDKIRNTNRKGIR